MDEDVLDQDHWMHAQIEWDWVQAAEAAPIPAPASIWPWR